MHNYSLLRLWGVFLRVGNTTFGGGDPTMLALHRELVVRRSWLTADQYALCFTLARVTPGTNMLAFCAAAAWILAGWMAAVGAILVVTVPSALLILWITAAYEAWHQNAFAMSAINGTVAAAVGMMVAGSWMLLKPHLRGSTRWLSPALAVGAAALSLWAKFSPVQILAIAVVIGYFWPRTDS